MDIVHEDSYFIYGFLMQVISQKAQHRKVLLSVWEIFLHQNNCSYNFYQISRKFDFIPLQLLKPKPWIKFSASLSGNDKCFYF